MEKTRISFSHVFTLVVAKGDSTGHIELFIKNETPVSKTVEEQFEAEAKEIATVKEHLDNGVQAQKILSRLEEYFHKSSEEPLKVSETLSGPIKIHPSKVTEENE